MTKRNDAPPESFILFGGLYRHGKRKVGLDVDAQNPTDTTRLYEKAGMHVERRYDFYEKELHPGEEVRP